MTWLSGGQSFVARSAHGGAFPAMQSGRWFDSRFSLPLKTGSSFGFSANSISACPIFVPAATIFDAIGITISVAGGAGKKFRLGIYAPRHDNWPGKLLYDSGEQPLDLDGDHALVIAGSITLGPGWFWLARFANDTHSSEFLTGNTNNVVAFNGQTALNVTTCQMSVSRTLTYGVLPADFGAGSASTGLIAPRLTLRAA
jgi:hypothetical protein